MILIWSVGNPSGSERLAKLHVFSLQFGIYTMAGWFNSWCFGDILQNAVNETENT